MADGFWDQFNKSIDWDFFAREQAAALPQTQAEMPLPQGMLQGLQAQQGAAFQPQPLPYQMGQGPAQGPEMAQAQGLSWQERLKGLSGGLQDLGSALDRSGQQITTLPPPYRGGPVGPNINPGNEGLRQLLQMIASRG